MTRIAEQAELKPVSAAARSTVFRQRKRYVRVVYITLLIASLNGCLEPDNADPDARDAIKEVNSAFGAAYQKMLEQIGTQNFAVDQAVAITTMESVLTGMGFVVRRREGDYYLHVAAPAPLPLNAAEWDLVRSLDEPLMRQIAVKHVGIKGNLARLQPEGLEIHGYLTLLPTTRGTRISITMRMLETKAADPSSILPRREYPPPHAAQLGYQKIWQRFKLESAAFKQPAATP